MLRDTTLIATIVMGLVPAFAGGFVASKLHLPPLVGYLLAGMFDFLWAAKARTLENAPYGSVKRAKKFDRIPDILSRRTLAAPPVSTLTLLFNPQR